MKRTISGLPGFLNENAWTRLQRASLRSTRCICLIAVLFLCRSTSFAQLQTQVVGDSVLVHGNNSTGELILENATKSINGFLYNKGNGRTEFRRGLIKLNDSTYIIGADTLKIGGGTNIGGYSDSFFGANSRATGHRLHSFVGYDLTIDSIRQARLNTDSMFAQTRYGFKYGYNNNNGRISATSNGTFAGGYTSTDSAVIEATLYGAHAEGFANGGRIRATARGAFAQGYTGFPGSVGFGPSGASIIASGTGTFSQGYAMGNGDTLSSTASGGMTRGAVWNGDMINSGTGAYLGGYLLGAVSTAPHRALVGSSSGFAQVLMGGQSGYISIASTASNGTIFGTAGVSNNNSEGRYFDTLQLIGNSTLAFMRGGAFRTSKVSALGYASTTFGTANYLSSITNDGYQSFINGIADTSSTISAGTSSVAAFTGGLAQKSGKIKSNGIASFTYGLSYNGTLLENTGRASFLFGSNTQNYQDSVFQVGWSGRQFRLTKDSLYFGNIPNAAAPYVLNYDPVTKAVTFGASSGNSILNQTALQGTANFNIDGSGKAASFENSTGNNYWNTTGGSTIIGYASGGGAPATYKFDLLGKARFGGTHTLDANGHVYLFNPTYTPNAAWFDGGTAVQVSPTINLSADNQGVSALSISPTWNTGAYSMYADGTTAALKITSAYTGISINQTASASAYGGQALEITQGTAVTGQAALRLTRQAGSASTKEFVILHDDRPVSTQGLIIPAFRYETGVTTAMKAGGGISFSMDRRYAGTEAEIQMYYLADNSSGSSNAQTGIHLKPSSATNGLRVIHGGKVLIGNNNTATSYQLEVSNATKLGSLNIASLGTAAPVSNLGLDAAGNVVAAGTYMGTVAVSIDFPNTTGGNSSDSTVTVTGAADGDVVSLGVPNASTAPNSFYTAWVSSANTVTIRFTNNGTSAINPASGTFKIKITK